VDRIKLDLKTKTTAFGIFQYLKFWRRYWYWKISRYQFRIGFTDPDLFLSILLLSRMCTSSCAPPTETYVVAVHARAMRRRHAPAWRS